MEILKGQNIQLAYDEKIVIDEIDFSINKGKVVSIIGTNGCGKSTLLKAIARVLNCKKGEIYLENSKIQDIKNKDFAKKLAFVSQNNEIPEDITVYDFIMYGRIPHKKWYEIYNEEDRSIVEWAIKICHLEKFRERKVMSLSGGERQKVWISMVLAQKTEILLLDEPTTYLDICHQFEIMELVKMLNRELGITIIMVLHDINQAAQYSDKIIVLKNGKKFKEGKPMDILNPQLIKDVYRVDSVMEIENNIPYFKLKGIINN